MKHTFSTLALVLVLSGCTSLAPEYQRPDLPVRNQWPDALQESADPQGTDTTSTADIPWQDFILDPTVRAIVQLALDNNRDLRIAVLNIERARQAYRISRSERVPDMQAAGSAGRQRTPASLSPKGVEDTSGQAEAGIGLSSWELDMFGRIDSLNDEALQRYLATEETARAVQLALVAEVLNACLNLGADRELLDLARKTHDTQRRAYELIARSEALGAATRLDLRQAQTQVETARVDIARYTSRVQEDINALTALIGVAVPPSLPETRVPGASLTLADLPAGLPADVLLERPDVIAAEHRLQAANANIGAARAAYFPRITLTASAGSASASLTDLFDGGSGFWQLLPRISLPIFNGGRLDAQLAVSETEQKIALSEYEKAIQTAFREVSDVLARRSTLGEQLDAQRDLVDATLDYHRLSEARFNRGVDSYLAVLDAQRSLYTAQQDLIRLRLTADTSNVQLYRVLGGGWKSSEAVQTTSRGVTTRSAPTSGES